MQRGLSELLMSLEVISADDGKSIIRMLPQEYNDRVLIDLKGALLNIAVPAAVLIEPFKMNERLRIQQGLFLCPLKLTSTIDGNLRGLWKIQDDTPDLVIEIREATDLVFIYQFVKVIKIVLPKNIHGAAINDLRSMNITSATLFPGIDGFARSLAHRFWSNDNSAGLPRLAHFASFAKERETEREHESKDA
jgi:hypothetical protein